MILGIVYVVGRIISNFVKVSYEEEVLDTFGSQKYASANDIARAGLFNPYPALCLGKYNNNMVGVSHDKEWHAISLGGSGTGKTTSNIIPTLLHFKGSAIVLDIKGELYKATAHKRSQYGQIVVINPTKEDTWRYNPLAACDNTPDGIIECEEFGRNIVPEPPGGAGQNQWVIDTTRALISAFVYEAAVQGEYMSDFVDTILGANVVFDAEGEVVPHHEVLAQRIIHGDDSMRRFGGGYVSENERTRGYYISSASNSLRTFATDEGIRRCTTPLDGKTFNFDMLEEGCTVYLQIPESKLKQSSDLWRIIFMQLLRHLQQRGEYRDRHILVCLDEFPQLGRISDLPEMLATLRSRNVHVLLAGQSIADIDEKYGAVTRRRIIDNCNFISIFGATDPEGQKYFSDMIGQETIIVSSTGENETRTMVGMGGGSQGHNISWQETGRPLIRPEDFRNLGNHVIVVAREIHPMRLQKAYYFLEESEAVNAV